MKNSIIYLGIALVVFFSASYATVNAKNEGKPARVQSAVANKQLIVLTNQSNFDKNEFASFDYKLLNSPVTVMPKEFSLPNTTVNFNEIILTNKIEKTADQLIAEDDAITENTISNQTQALDFNVINNNGIAYEEVISVLPNKIEKTADQLIAEDNAITENTISNETQALDFNVINNNAIVYEEVISVFSNKIEKTADQLIAEDNAITENTISNQTQALDFNVINNNGIAYEDVVSVPTNKIEKTADQLIAEDNAITENTISNETQALDFNAINRNSIFVIENNKSLFAIE